MRVVYHQHCADGEAGLWSFKQRSCMDLTGLILDGQSPGCKNLDLEAILKEPEMPLYFIDICPTEEQLEKLLDTMKEVVILDHHKTNLQTVNKFKDRSNLKAVFDMDRSGCQIAWDYFTDEPRPPFLDYVADRDIWTWKLENSKEINEGMSFYGTDKFDEYYKNWDLWKEQLITTGKIMDVNSLKKIDKIIERGNMFYYQGDPEIKGMVVANTDYNLTSRLGNLICERNPSLKLAVVVSGVDFKDKKYSLSLRSKGFDVSAVAKRFGGGGHNCAAGCKMSFNEFEKNIVIENNEETSKHIKDSNIFNSLFRMFDLFN
uniref:DHHA1 domain-containing protein n=1 Tax=viral metagenome TaxID=1070528 RepID=A0A6C0AC43_9ZZZZ